MAAPLKELLINGQQGKAILFAGAGCSIDCLDYQIEDLPTVNPLLKKICEALGKEVSTLDRAAEMLFRKDPAQYLSLIHRTFNVRTVPDDLEKIMQYKWDRIYTTNYDNALELAAKNVQVSARPVVPTDNPKLIPQDTLQIVHLHGFVEQFDANNIGKDCILGRTSNITNEVYDGHWGKQLRVDIVTADIVVFVGYSLYDPQIPRLIRSASTSKDKIFFVNSMVKNEELAFDQEDYGESLWIGRDGFAKIASSASKQARGKSRTSFVCFEKSMPTVQDDSLVKRSDLVDLFIFGAMNDQLISKDIQDGDEKYHLQTNGISKAMEYVSSGADITAIYAPLGHGKTLMTRTLLHRLRAGTGRSVFLAHRNHDEFRSELEEIIEISDRPIIILDDFFKYRRHWDYLRAMGPSKVQLVVTARINVYELRKTEFHEFFDQFSIEEFRIPNIDRREAGSLARLISQAGLWKTSEVEISGKIQALLHKYGANFADILIGMMKSTDIVSRFRKELEILRQTSPQCYQDVLLTLYLEYVNASSDLVVLDDDFDKRLKTFLKDEETAELLGVFLSDGLGRVRYHSSVFSQFALESICDHDAVVEVIEQTVRRLEHIATTNDEYSKMLSDLLRFNYLRSLSVNGNFERIHNLYDRLSAVDSIAEDDLFWNAFGMCQRAREKYGDARSLFETSIRKAREKRKRWATYHPYQTENQLLVCILEQGVIEDFAPDQAFEDAGTVIRLLHSQIEDSRASESGQAFQWFQQLEDFCSKNFQIMEQDQVEITCAKLTRYNIAIKKSVKNWDRVKNAPDMLNSIQRIIANSKALTR